MLELSDPSELSQGSLYRQANLLATKTSRAFNGDWYKSPRDLSCQWHLWVDGGSQVISTLHDVRSGWHDGPVLNSSIFLDNAAAEAVLAELIEHSSTYFSSKVSSLGILIHVADEFNLADLQQEQRSESDYASLSQQLLDEPAEVLTDKRVNVATNTWRLLPYFGADPNQPNCAAVVLSRGREEFMRQLRNYGDGSNFPVRTMVLSAPLEVLATLQILAPQKAGQGQIYVLQYLKFTVLYAFNTKGDLITARSLPHRGTQPLPSGFAQIVVDLAINQNLERPKVVVLPMGLALQASVSEVMLAHNAANFPIEVEAISLEEFDLLNGIPFSRPELLIHSNERMERIFSGEAGGKGGANTKLLETWSLQDFDQFHEESRFYPAQKDLQILRFSKWFIMLVMLAFISLCGYGGWQVYLAVNQRAWNLTNEEIEKGKMKLATLSNEKKAMDFSKNLFFPRSRGWVLLEFLLSMVPEESGSVKISKVDYYVDAVTESTIKGATAKDSGKLGFNRNWKIVGFAQRDAFAVLATLNSQAGIRDFFKRLGQSVQDDTFNPDIGERTFLTQLTQKINPSYNKAAIGRGRDNSTQYPLYFEINITQSFSKKDPIAVIEKSDVIAVGVK